MALRQLANRRIDPVLPTSCFPDKNGNAGVALATIVTAANTEHDGVDNVAIVQVVALFAINMVDAHLLQPTPRAKATLRSSTGTDHRQDLSSTPPTQSMMESIMSPSHRSLHVSQSRLLMTTSCKRPVEPKPPSEVSPHYSLY
jgi:hypothetical protein